MRKIVCEMCDDGLVVKVDCEGEPFCTSQNTIEIYKTKVHT